MRTLIAVIALTAATTGAHADVGAFVGVTYAFDGKSGPGITLQATSSRREDHAIVAAGVSFHPFAPGQKFGIPVGVGYQLQNAAVVAGYDVLLQSITLAGGYANTRDEGRAAAPAPAQVVTPAPGPVAPVAPVTPPVVTPPVAPVAPPVAPVAPPVAPVAPPATPVAPPATPVAPVLD